MTRYNESNGWACAPRKAPRVPIQKILAKIVALNQQVKKLQKFAVRKLGALVETRSITHVLDAWIGLLFRMVARAK
jgi:hypothetical protein